MASSAVHTAVYQRALQNWSQTEIRGPNPESGNVRSDGGAFLEIQYPVATETQMSIGAPGNNIWREEGAIRFVLALPVGTGLGLWLFHIDNLRAAFRGREFDGVRTYAADPAVVNGDTDDGAYTLVSFTVADEFDAAG